MRKIKVWSKKGNYMMEMKDKTRIAYSPNLKALIGKAKNEDVLLHMFFPKAKFWPLFEMQMWDKKKDITLSFTKDEFEEFMAFLHFAKNREKENESK